MYIQIALGILTSRSRTVCKGLGPLGVTAWEIVRLNIFHLLCGSLGFFRRLFSLCYSLKLLIKTCT